MPTVAESQSPGKPHQFWADPAGANEAAGAEDARELEIVSTRVKDAGCALTLQPVCHQQQQHTF